MSLTAGDDLLAIVARRATNFPTREIAVAVSGGGDSAALLQVLAQYARTSGTSIIAATIDHCLRAASAAEAAQVADVCAGLGIAHTTLKWVGWDGSGNLQDAARSARYRLLADWARANGCGQVWLGHTADDQAETFLMRLARGSGVDGLSAMPEAVTRDGIEWVRPFLTVSRERLRQFLGANGLRWIDDPSNADPRFERIKFRNAAESLAELGLTRERLNATAAAMTRARAALERMTEAFLHNAATTSVAGEVTIEGDALAKVEAEIRLRGLARVLMWVSGAVYRPRLEALEHLDQTISNGELAGGMTLHGCTLRRERDFIVVRRELARMAGKIAANAGVWDGRWRISGPLEGHLLGGLGASGLEQVTDWRQTKLSREALMTTPGIWRGDVLIAAPVAGMEMGFAATFCQEFQISALCG